MRTLSSLARRRGASIRAADPNIVGRSLTLDWALAHRRRRDAARVRQRGVLDAVRRCGRLSLAAPCSCRPTARLRDGVSLEAASAEANVIGLGLRGIEPAPGAAPRFEIVRELDQITAAVMPALRVLVVAVAAVLLIVCTNVANLLLVRGTRRQQEIAIRRSLGATRGRIVRLVLAESFVLAACGALRGYRTRVWRCRATQGRCTSPTSRSASRRGAAILPRIDEIAIDPVVLAFVGGLSLVTRCAVRRAARRCASRASAREVTTPRRSSRPPPATRASATCSPPCSSPSR